MKPHFAVERERERDKKTLQHSDLQICKTAAALRMMQQNITLQIEYIVTVPITKKGEYFPGYSNIHGRWFVVWAKTHFHHIRWYQIYVSAMNFFDISKYVTNLSWFIHDHNYMGCA